MEVTKPLLEAMSITCVEIEGGLDSIFVLRTDEDYHQLGKLFIGVQLTLLN